MSEETELLFDVVPKTVNANLVQVGTNQGVYPLLLNFSLGRYNKNFDTVR
ncbi:hypothetical protein LEP1GSC203_1668 [Leptospira terpstrae serovar Hualin str. LT 11-33 = ATCC 700639]|uniref:Uncharacterized protein n=1 Tax=Leptospira terpstrae serovar Hualin str. LT 11-33 = ATCC 700639 TaxID=1257025 RepID=N1W058_9LEPT|nr:hypothetical protein LEP1GSC203_1668 [Leptospira terpstrae serovar Hualin str. LT 11-33 = ATCC 700639]